MFKFIRSLFKSAAPAAQEGTIMSEPTSPASAGEPTAPSAGETVAPSAPLPEVASAAAATPGRPDLFKLKIKRKALAAEIQIIEREIAKTKRKRRHRRLSRLTDACVSLSATDQRSEMEVWEEHARAKRDLLAPAKRFLRQTDGWDKFLVAEQAIREKNPPDGRVAAMREHVVGTGFLGMYGKGGLRYQARVAHLAWCCLTGTPYFKAEQDVGNPAKILSDENLLEDVGIEVMRHSGTLPKAQAVAIWLPWEKTAKAHLRNQADEIAEKAKVAAKALEKTPA